MSKIKSRQVDGLKMDNVDRERCLNTEVTNAHRGTN
jgi:hypothetical protein